MRKYVALWHIGGVTRGEVIALEDREAERLTALGAVKPVPEEMPKAPAGKPAEAPAADGEWTEPESAEAETEALPELEIAAEMVGEAEPPKKKGRGKRS